MLVAMQHVSLVVTYACISAAALPPAVLLFRAGRWKSAAVVLLAGMLASGLGVWRELLRQQRFYGFMAAQGYQAEPVPFLYLPEEQLRGLLIAYPVVTALSAVVTVAVADLTRKAERP